MLVCDCEIDYMTADDFFGGLWRGVVCVVFGVVQKEVNSDLSIV